MTTNQMLMLAFQDQVGAYYLLPIETLERGRVPAERRDAVAAQLAALPPATGEEDDVQGYLRCVDAKRLNSIHWVTALALEGVGDFAGAGYFLGMANGTYDGGCGVTGR
jgi:hypothetical protein